MRELTSHKVNGLNEAITIVGVDEPSEGNACHEYVMHTGGKNGVCVRFQKGPILESGVNGVSNEALLAIVEDRLLGFQAGKFSCRENAVALTKLQEAMM